MSSRLVQFSWCWWRCSPRWPDPARLSVADQMRRLEEGAIAADQFDYKFLRFEAARYGREALERLAARKDQPPFADAANRADKTLQMKTPRDPVAIPPRELAAAITVYPSGQTLPARFLEKTWVEGGKESSRLPACPRSNAKCDAFFVDLDGDGAAEIVLMAAPPDTGAGVFKAGSDGEWTYVSGLTNTSCPGVRDALRSGNFQPADPSFREIEAAGARLRLFGHNCR